MDIEFKNVSYSYNGLEKALSDVSFSVHGNHIFCLSDATGQEKAHY